MLATSPLTRPCVCVGSCTYVGSCSYVGSCTYVGSFTGVILVPYLSITLSNLGSCGCVNQCTYVGKCSFIEPCTCLGTCICDCVRHARYSCRSLNLYSLYSMLHNLQEPTLTTRPHTSMSNIVLQTNHSNMGLFQNCITYNTDGVTIIAWYLQHSAT